ncbi:MAG: flagellar motor switch protein FliM [Pseudomonadota bacterium]|jgi:flagellar motor switch protein FliM|nr:flagellar motor switch protein FliM [Pseudomonadota bacterium]QKK06234.1 MAG: flagellar motor switch protein FliM [Pseudomonadota bacterium]|tara:strand:- start:2167 stop:3225 length:1059 start_codon:yes stop_codon:yes gene_type:complete
MSDVSDNSAEEIESAAGPAPGDLDMTDEEGRILDQDEIDELLGFDEDADELQSTGIMELINSALVNYERLPMLDIVFDRLVRLMSTSLRNLTSDNVEISLDHISSVRFGDYLNSIPLPAMLCIFKAEEWDDHGLLVVDSALVYSVVDVLLGGRRGTSAMRVEGRPFTTIETTLIERMVNVVLGDMTSAFDPLSPVNFRLERIETNPRFATITQGNNAGVLVRMRIDMGDRSGRVEVMIPYATLEPIRELLLQMFMGEKFGQDSIWENHLTNELYMTDIEVQAILGETTVSLHDILNWEPGATVMFNTRVEDSVELRVGEHPMFTAKTGQRQGRIAVNVETYIAPGSGGGKRS